MNQFISDKKIGVAISVTDGAAGSTDITGATVDTANSEGVAFTVQLGAIVSGAVTSLKLQESANGSSWTDVANTSITVADDDDNEVRYLDYHRPAQRYVRVYADRATQNATMTATYATYGNKSLPLSSQPAGTEGVAVAG
jgi:hypothetical protein